MMIEVDTQMVRIVFAFQNTSGNAARCLCDIVAGSHDIGNGNSLAVNIPGTFCLVGSDGTAS